MIVPVTSKRRKNGGWHNSIVTTKRWICWKLKSTKDEYDSVSHIGIGTW